jgi:adenylosuccinate synthase
MYPFVTSSNALAGALSLGAGFPFRRVDYVLGVVKAYMSKVGAGPFPTEIHGELADRLRDVGNEYGTVTRRPRRVGWLDLPMLKYSIRMNDVDAIALTRLDTLGEMDTIKICTSYKKNGKELNYIPRSFKELEELELTFREVESWGKLDPEILKKHDYSMLPQKMKDYIRIIEDELKVPVEVLSLGEGRENTIVTQGSRLNHL